MFAVAFSPLIWTAASAVAADDSAAHALAEKFSRAEDAERAEAAKKAEAKKKAEAEKARAEAQHQAERRKATVDQRAKDEAEMQEAAQQEAEARRAADQRAAEERTRIESEQGAARADAARLAQEAEQRRIEDDRKAEEARQAEAARLAKDVEEKRLADERKAEDARQAEAARQAEERKAEDARIAKEAEEKRLGEEHRAARIAKVAEDKRRAEAAKKAEKFRLAREAREARLAREREQAAHENGTDTANSDTRNSLGGPARDAAPPTAPWDATDTGPARFLPTRVTILLVMDPRKRVFAAYPPTANPVLCIGQGCYVSGGAGAPAEYMPRFSALGPANSIGRRAGPCRNQLTCVFRDVELGGGYGQIQPVDMGLLHHDRREIRGVRPDPTCDLISGRLFCAEPTVAEGYRAWIVPEVIATKAGAEVLREALAQGLPTVRSADADTWHVRVHAESSR
jgi:colicin import membrane protein